MFPQVILMYYTTIEQLRQKIKSSSWWFDSYHTYKDWRQKRICKHRMDVSKEFWYLNVQSKFHPKQHFYCLLMCSFCPNESFCSRDKIQNDTTPCSKYSMLCDKNSEYIILRRNKIRRILFYLSSGFEGDWYNLAAAKAFAGDVVDGPLDGDGYNLVLIPANTKHKEA